MLIEIKMAKNSMTHMLTEPAFKMGFAVWAVATVAYFIFISSTLDLSRLDAAPLIAFTATKEIDYGTATNRRI